jgi:hypothetical protein
VSYDVLAPAAARLWPHAPDWSRGFDVKRSFATDIFPARDGTEQRRATRHEPRLSARYRTLVTGADLRAAELHLRAWQNKPVVVPDFARWARLTGSSSAGASTLTISPMPAWIAADQPLVLCKAGIEEQVLVIGVVGSTVTLDDPLVNAWAIGDVVRPSLFGLFNAQIVLGPAQRRRCGVRHWHRLLSGRRASARGGTAWASLNSIEVFTPLPDYAGSPSVGHIWPIDQVDYGRGRTAQFRPVATSWRARSRPSSTACRRPGRAARAVLRPHERPPRRLLRADVGERLRAGRVGDLRIQRLHRLRFGAVRRFRDDRLCGGQRGRRGVPDQRHHPLPAHHGHHRERL